MVFGAVVLDEWSLGQGVHYHEQGNVKTKVVSAIMIGVVFGQGLINIDKETRRRSWS